MHGMFKFAHVAAMMAATLFVASVGLVAASGPDVFTAPFSHDDGVEFNARVLSVSTSLLYVQRESEGFVFLQLGSDTRYEDAAGHSIERTAVQRNARIFVRATRAQDRFFNAQLIRLLEVQAEPTPVDATPKPTPVEEPKPTPAETPKPAPEPTHEPSQKPTPVEQAKPTPTPGAAVEFWGVVTAVNEGSLNVDVQGTTPVQVLGNGDTQYPTGYPFVGVKVWVLGAKNADGSYTAIKVTVKIAEFSGVADPVGDTSMTVTAGCAQKTVRFDSRTVFANGFPKAQDSVAVRAYIMGDGTFLATDVTVNPEAPLVFCGVITQVNPEPNTIYVLVGDVEKHVCYENAAVYPGADALVAGKKVEVKVDHFDGSTYFAGPSGYVKVLN